MSEQRKRLSRKARRAIALIQIAASLCVWGTVGWLFPPWYDHRLLLVILVALNMVLRLATGSADDVSRAKSESI